MSISPNVPSPQESYHYESAGTPRWIAILFGVLIAAGADPSVAKELIHGNNPVEKSRTYTDAVYITNGLMKQTYAVKQQILVGGKAVQIFDRNSSGALTGGRWVNVQSVIQGKFFYQGTEWKPGNTY